MSSRMYQNVTTMDVEYGCFTDFRSPFVRRVSSSGSLSCLHVAIVAGMWASCGSLYGTEQSRSERCYCTSSSIGMYVKEGEGGNDARSE